MQQRPKVSFTIPEPPKDASPQLRQMLLAMKEAVEVRLGRRGDPLEEAVTKRDLVDSGIARLSGLGPSGPLQPVVVEPAEARITPPAPVAFQVEGVFGGITLTWDHPTDLYSVHAYTEVYRSETNDPNTRILVDSSRGNTYFDRIPDGGPVTFYYWIRFVSEYNREGPFSEAKLGTKLRDVDELMAELSGNIDESDLSKEFQEGYEDVRNRLATAESTISAHGSSITATAKIVGDESSGLVADNSANKKAITGLSAQYTLKLNTNGYISGFGAYNNGTTSQFVVVSDTFWIAPPNSTGKTKPFIVDNGKVYIDTAVIKDASIQEGKLGSITFGKIKDASGNPVTTVGGTLRADMIDVGNLKVTDANISGVIKSAAKASNGQPRWMLDKNGGMTLNGSGTAGRMEIRDTVIKVFDSSGRLRVQLGDLTA